MPGAEAGVPRLRLGNHNMGEIDMNNLFLKMYVKVHDLMSHEEGQDLVEYALVVALIAFGATAGMSKLSSAINTAFGNISTTLGASIT